MPLPLQWMQSPCHRRSHRPHAGLARPSVVAGAVVVAGAAGRVPLLHRAVATMLQLTMLMTAPSVWRPHPLLLVLTLPLDREEEGRAAAAAMPPVTVTVTGRRRRPQLLLLLPVPPQLLRRQLALLPVLPAGA